MANTYPTTQFPLGSTEVKVLFNNASNFDEAMNSELPSFYDRFNKRRETWAGMQKMVADFLEAMGFEATHLVYVDGTPLTVLRPTQLIDRAGSVYKVKMPANFPVNLTGNWATDQLLLVDVGDASLRDDLSVASVKDLATHGQNSTLPFYLRSYHEGFATGGSVMVWVSSLSRSLHDGVRIFSPTVPSGSLTTDQATIISYMNKTGETAPSDPGCYIRLFTGPVFMEYGGVVASVECGLLAQKIIDLCVPSGVSVACDAPMTIATTLTLPQYRTTPNVSRDFNLSRVDLRYVTFTASSGTALRSEGSTSRLSVGRLIGPGPDAGITKGVYITGQGGNIVDVGMVSGFQNNIEFNQSFANTLTIGWWDDAIRGIALYASNDNRIKGGRGGGRFSFGVPPTDDTTCDIGIFVNEDCAHNNIDSNIEYCRRTNASIGIADNGVATQYEGYIESCRGHNILAQGKNGYFKILAGGTVLRSDGAIYHAGDTNNIELTTQIDYYNQAPSGSNTSLTFQTPQAFSTAGTGRIHGPNGMETISRNTLSAVNKLASSNALGAVAWSSSVTGAASWSGVTSTSSTAMPDVGYMTSTQLTFPALAGDDAIYKKAQGSLSMLAGPVSFGCFVLCTAGDADIMMRVVKGDGTIQHTHISRVQPSTNFQKIGSELTYAGANDAATTFEISFRTSVGATLLIANTYFMNRVDVEFPPHNNAAVRGIIAGKDVRGSAHYNGMQVNGSVQHSYSPKITGSFTLGDPELNYPTYMVSASGVAYNILIVTGVDGQVITIKRDGTAGTVNLVPSGTTIDGSSSSVSLTTAWSSLKLQYHAVDGWLKI